MAGQKILTDASTVFKDCAGGVVADNFLFVYGYYLVDRIQIWLRPNTAPPVAAVVGMNLCQLDRPMLLARGRRPSPAVTCE